MPQISLTDFVDFVVRSGATRLTKVRQLKERGEYEPAFDFWRPLREAIVEFHRDGGGDKTQLRRVLVGITDSKKLARYPETLHSYTEWLGRKRPQWFDPPRADWAQGGLTVKVNPELGLVLKHEKHVIKLYFKDDALSKNKVSVVIALMEKALANANEPNLIFSILDIANRRLHLTSSQRVDLRPLLIAEAAAFVSLWNQL